MGVYDQYGKLGIQIKVGHCCLAQYEIGDDVEIPDGVYVANEGAIVIVDGKFVAEFETMTSKWGDVLDAGEILRPHSPMLQSLDELCGSSYTKRKDD